MPRWNRCLSALLVLPLAASSARGQSSPPKLAPAVAEPSKSPGEPSAAVSAPHEAFRRFQDIFWTGKNGQVELFMTAQPPAQAVPTAGPRPAPGDTVELDDLPRVYLNRLQGQVLYQPNPPAAPFYTGAFDAVLQSDPFAATSSLGAVLTPADDALRLALNLPKDRGLVVSQITRDGAAERIKLQLNDIVLAIDGQAIPRPEAFDLVLPMLAHAHDNDNDPKKASTTHMLEVIRGGKPLTLPVQIRSGYSLDAVPEAARPDLFIGVMTTPVDGTLRSHLAIPKGTGLLVQDVVADAPALQAGVQKGDVLLSFDAKPVADSDQFRALIQANGAKPAAVEYLRKGKPATLTITPAQRPKSTEIAAADERLDPTRLLIRRLTEAPSPVPAPHTIEVVPNWNTAFPPLPDTAKKLDDLSAQIQALTKAVEELRKAQPPAGPEKK